ncbi:MAG: ABC transporter [Rhodobacteraceae bacterium]|nr:ABC transporter [Paracoccaceae bacterium]
MTRLRALAVLLLALFCLAAPPGPARATDYFGHPDNPTAAQAAQPQVEARVTLPEPFRTILGTAITFQRALDARLRANLDAAGNGGGWAADLAIVLAAFLYGVLHAVGPGHGKVVVASYLATRRTRFVHALEMSGTVAAVQALLAVVLVGALAVIFGSTGKAILDHAGTIEMASYVAIALMGLWMAWAALRPGPAPACGCALPHDHDHHHDHHHHDAPPPRRSQLAQMLTTGGLAGLRPCSGAILVLLFTLANGIFVVGIAATLAMGVGVALTVAAVSVGAVGLNRAVAATGRGRSRWVGRAAAFSGAMVIAAFGAAAATAIATGMIAPLIG